MGNNIGVAYSSRKRVDRKIENHGYHTYSCSKISNIEDSAIQNGCHACLKKVCSEFMKKLSLNGEVNSDIDLYNDVTKAHKRDTSLVLGEHPFPLDTTWCDEQKSYSKSIVSRISNWAESPLDVQEGLEKLRPEWLRQKLQDEEGAY